MDLVVNLQPSPEVWGMILNFHLIWTPPTPPLGTRLACKDLTLKGRGGGWEEGRHSARVSNFKLFLNMDILKIIYPITAFSTRVDEV